jgi:hypothetical protein
MMSVTIFKRAINTYATFPAAALLLVGTGCGGDREIKTYKVAKEDNHSHAAQAHASAVGATAERPSVPHLHAKTPEGWQELAPEKMRVASFRVTGDGGKTAEVAVIPLPGVSKIELRSVNMWREELGLGELTSDQLKDETEPVQVGDAQGLMVELSGTRAGETSSDAGILGAVAERGAITWFVKMAGDKDLVLSQKENFVSYLKSLEFHEGAHSHASEAEVTQVAQVPNAENPVSSNTEKLPAGSAKPNFKSPENWKSKPPGQMVTSAYNIEGDGGQAEVTVSKFPGDVGGMVANIQRWRGQLGLPPGTAEDARKSAEMFEVGGKKDSYMVDLKGTNVRTGKSARMISIGVPFEGDTWFFKLMGDDAVVGKEKDKFLKFVKEAY